MNFSDFFKKHLLGPIDQCNPTNIESKDWYSYIFNVNTRHLAIYVMKKDIKARGIFLENGVHSAPGQGTIYRKGEPILVRKDDVLCRIEVQYKETVHRISNHDWEIIREACFLKRGQIEI